LLDELFCFEKLILIIFVIRILLENINIYMKSQFTIGVFGMIFDEQNRVLLCHRTDYDLWNLPGGGLESGEAPWDGVKREVKEETGLDVEVVSLAGVYSKPDQNDIVFSFICRAKGGEPTLNDEADRIEYFGVDKLPSNTSLKQIERIKDAFKNSKELILKVQLGKGGLEILKETKLKKKMKTHKM
jgi:ADP-ribose pyrophosphatase YjhB (NUDIX family)